jgi:hypothetical protein
MEEAMMIDASTAKSKEPTAPAEHTALRPLALAVSVGLSLPYLVVYSGINWFTLLRADVGIWRLCNP